MFLAPSIEKLMCRILKVLLKSIGLFLLSIVSLIGLYLLFALTFSIIGIKAKKSVTTDVSIYILTNGVHTDLVVPLRNRYYDWSKKLNLERNKKYEDIKYIAVGWGNRGFYIETPTWADLKVKTAVKAILGIGASAIHVTLCREVRENKYCKKIELSNEQYSRLTEFIEHSFLLDKNGNYIGIHAPN
jgi:uncharacterized protein (TIGR02117 family)